MRSVLFGVAYLALVTSPTSSWSQIQDWEFPYWIGHFEICGSSAQTVEEWPGLGLVEEYRFLEQEMLEDATRKGASSEQLLELSEAFDSGRRQVQMTEWKEGAKLEDLSPEQFDDIVSGLRENRQSCPSY